MNDPIVIPGGWYVDALASGEYACVIYNSHIQTHLGTLPLVDRQNPLYLRVRNKGGFELTGANSVTDRLMTSDGRTWTFTNTPVFGNSPVIFDADQNLRVISTLADALREGTGSTGYSFVDPVTRQLVRTDDCHTGFNGLYDWVRIAADLWVGQTDQPEFTYVWDGANLRVLNELPSRFIRVNVQGENVAISHFAGKNAYIYFCTLDELRALPLAQPARTIGPLGPPLPDGTWVDVAKFFGYEPSCWPRGNPAKGDTHGMDMQPYTHNGVPCLWLAKFDDPTGSLGELDYVEPDPDGYIHSVADCSSPDTIAVFTDTRMLKKRMQIGRQYGIDFGDFTMHVLDRATGALLRKVPFNKEQWIEAVWPKFWCGSDWGECTVLQYVYNNTGFRPGNGTGDPNTKVETYFMAIQNATGKVVGWGDWTEDPSDLVFAHGGVTWPSPPTVHSAFWHLGGTRYPPSVPAFIPGPQTPAPKPPMPPIPPVQPMTRYRLKPGDILRADAPLVSQDTRFRLLYQSDGNLVLYGPHGPMWSTGTAGQTAGFCAMQGDGNFVLYNKAGQPRWASNTNGHLGAWLLLQNDGNVVIYGPTGAAVWATNTVYVPPAPGPIPPAVVKFPALMASYYAAPTDPDCDLEVLGQFYADCGVQGTRGWLLDAWSLGQRDAAGKFLKGQYDGFLPCLRSPDGRFDLWAWNPAYFARIRRFVETMNRYGVFCHLTILELYTWSQRKAVLPFVPDANQQPYRHNVNGVRWGDPDDPTFFSLPDPWLTAFCAKVVDTLNGLAWLPEIGNEMPEKDLHYRLRDALRAGGWTGEITVNRNEDTPGQYWNMGIDSGKFQRLAIHGKLDMSYLDEEYPDEAAAGRPTTFQAMWPLVDASRIIMSSDGGGGNPVHLENLKAVACDALKRGASYEHQLALKRNRFFGDGSLRMADLEIDRPMLTSLSACRRRGW